jgi:PAS domain S-box-containing protein
MKKNHALTDPLELLEHVNDAFFGLNQQWQFTYMNTAAESLLQKKRDVLIGQGIWDAFPEAVESVFYQKYHEAREKQQEVAFEAYYPPLDTWFFVKAYPDKVNGLLVFFNNINELKATEQKLRQSEETFRTLFNNMTLGVVYQDSDKKITAANPAAEHILGLSLDEMAGRVSADPRWKAMDEKGFELPGDRHPSVLALESGQPVIGFYMQVFNPKINQYRWLLVDAMPQYREGEPRPFQVFALFRDITDQQQAMADKEEMVYLITHDLRSPINSAQALLDIIVDKVKPDTHDINRELAYMGKALKRASRLMEDLVDLAKLEAGGGSVNPQQVSLEQLIRDIDDTQRPLVEAAGLDWHMNESTGQQTKIRVDMHRIQQVFENLVGNAVKFTNPPGRISLRVYREAGAVVFDLEDSGRGIEAAAISRIFDKFWQPKDMEKKKGAGLGLYIVKKIVEAHQGSIEVSSQAGTGTRFTIRLPQPAHL